MKTGRVALRDPYPERKREGVGMSRDQIGYWEGEVLVVRENGLCCYEILAVENVVMWFKRLRKQS